MKRISLMCISLLLALSLLAGCAMPDFATSFVVTQEQGSKRDSFDSFDELEYVRPDMEQMQHTVEQLSGALKSPFKVKRINELLDEFYAQCSNYNTMYVLAYIRSSKDMKDEYYAGEYSWILSRYDSFQLLIEQAYGACAASMHVFWLEPLKFWEGFREEYAPGEVSGDPAALRYGELSAREVELISEYRSFVSAPTVSVAGEEMDFDEYILQLPPYAHAEAYGELYRKNNLTLGEMYVELIGIHREMAELLGYDSYAAMEYQLSYSRDYGPEEAEEYIAHVRQYLVPVWKSIEQQALGYPVEYKSLSSRELLLWLETAAEGFDGSIEQAYNYMRAHELYDLEYSDSKMNTSFQAYLEDYDAPYLFVDPYGNIWDIITVFHEFGHYANAYMRYDAPESMDLSECFSHAMEFLALGELDCILSAQELEQMYQMVLLDMLDTILQQTALAEFELSAHEMQSPTVEKLNQLWLQLSMDYGIYDEESDAVCRYAWSETPHLFESPFYVLSYPVSAAVALELYELELGEEGAGIAKFIEMSQSGLEGLMETLDFASLQDPMSEERVMETAEFLERKILK